MRQWQKERREGLKEGGSFGKMEDWYSVDKKGSSSKPQSGNLGSWEKFRREDTRARSKSTSADRVQRILETERRRSEERRRRSEERWIATQRRRSEERKRSRSKSKEKSRRRSKSRGRERERRRETSKETRDRIRRSRERRQVRSKSRSKSREVVERTPSPSTCARLPPHLLGGWAVYKG